MFREDDLLPLSGIQHITFCERQWALIHIEQMWHENRLTAEGRLLHERVDEPSVETRPGVRIVRAMPVRSLTMGVSGICDVVEFAGAEITPVEYKRGKPKADVCDEVQLCAQAMCIEEMTGAAVSEGAVFYGQIRRRHGVTFTPELREQVRTLCGRMHQLASERRTPGAVFGKWCRSCSLVDVCLPRTTSQGAASGRDYLEREIRRALREDHE